jgi:hypothetical protein
VEITHGGTPVSDWKISWELKTPFTNELIDSGSFTYGFKYVNLINNGNILTAVASATSGYYISNTTVRRYSTTIL